MRIQPKKGDAIIFASMTPAGEVDPLAEHGSCAITSGEKYVLQRWVRPTRNPAWAKDEYAPW